MSEQHQTRNSNPLNANLVAFILIINFIVIGGLIVANMPLPSPQVNGEAHVEVALVAPTATPQPSNTPLPPTFTSTQSPTERLIPSATPQAVSDAALSMEGHTAADYDPALAARGEPLFAQCAACHGADALGLPNLGKNLVESEFLHSLTDEELLAFIKTGRPMWDPLNTTGIDMPPKGGNPALTDDDIMVIIAYIHSLVPADGAEETAEIPLPPVVTSTLAVVPDVALPGGVQTTTDYDPAQVSQGAALFMQCAACHGPDARGIPNLGKNLVESEFLHSLTDEELLAFIKTGRPLWDPLNTTGIDMPPKGGNPAITDEEILAIIAYIRSLSTSGG
jgi:mono/diheme cytochrome c family protein